MSDDFPVVLLVALEGLAETDVVKPGQQHLPQGDTARGAVAGDRVCAGDEVAFEGEQHPHLLGEEAYRHIRCATGAVKDVEETRGQALVQGKAAGRADRHAVALQAIVDGAVALVDRGADPGLLETLREGQTANAAADDENMK